MTNRKAALILNPDSKNEYGFIDDGLGRRMRKRRKREKERHRREILEAALAVFAEKGYHQATMQEIAQQAEFAVGTLYLFFPSKKALYEALVWEEAQRFHQRIMAAFKNLPSEPLKALEKIIEAKITAVREQFVFVRVFLSELWEARFRGGLPKNLRALYEEYLEELAKVLEGVNASGLTSRRLAALVDALISTLLVEAVEAGEPLPPPGEILRLLVSPLLLGGNEPE